VADAQTFVADACRSGQTFHAIIIDVYASERFPPSLCTPAFFDSCRALVAPTQGVVALNAGCADDPLHLQVLQTMRDAFQPCPATCGNDRATSGGCSGGAGGRTAKLAASLSVVAVTELAVEMDAADRFAAQTSSSGGDLATGGGGGSGDQGSSSSGSGGARAYESAVLLGRCGVARAEALLSAEAWAAVLTGGDPRTSTTADAAPCERSLLRGLPFVLGDTTGEEGAATAAATADATAATLAPAEAAPTAPAPPLAGGAALGPGSHQASKAPCGSSQHGGRWGGMAWRQVEWQPTKPSTASAGPAFDPGNAAWGAFGNTDSDSD
jgi:hypothetical protein